MLLGWYRDGGNVAARLPWLSTYLGHHDPRSTYWYLSAAPELLALAADRLERIPGDGAVMSTIAATLQSFFTERLTTQRQVSEHTIASYRDTCRLLLEFMQRRTGTSPSRLQWSDLDADAVSAFLDHLEADRHNGPRTRNARLTAIRSLFVYASLRHPEHAASIAKVLAIPPKRFDKAIVTYLDQTEANALLAAPDRSIWTGGVTTPWWRYHADRSAHFGVTRTQLRRRRDRHRCPRSL